MLIHMTTMQRNALIVAILITLGIAAFAVNSNYERQERAGTEALDAAEVIDLEVQAQKEFEAAGGTY